MIHHMRSSEWKADRSKAPRVAAIAAVFTGAALLAASPGFCDDSIARRFGGGGGGDEELMRQLDDGWTDFSPSTGTRMIHVSTSGDDSNSGLNPSAPVRSLARAYELLRDGQPDWMLLKRGDVWQDQVMPMWRKSGRSESEPMLIAAYGDPAAPRPLIDAGNSTAFQSKDGMIVQNIAIVGLAFQADRPSPDDGGTGMRWLASGGNLLIEDCFFSGFTTNVVIQNVGSDPLRNVRIRRSVIVDSYNAGGHSQGIFCKRVDGLVIEENLLDHNGWREGVEGAHRTIFNHNIYIQNDCSNLVVRDNIICRGSSHGLQARPGGAVRRNVFAGNAIALLVGGGDYPNEGGVVGDVRRNLLLYGSDIATHLPRGHGITLQNIRSATLMNNIVAFDRSEQPYGHAVYFEANRDVGVHNVTMQNNRIVNWRGGIKYNGLTGSQLSGIVIRDNLLQDDDDEKPLVKHADTMDPDHFTYADNIYHTDRSRSSWYEVNRVNYGFTQWVALAEEEGARDLEVDFSDETRSLARYHGLMARPADEVAFYQALRNQRRGAWLQGYTAAQVIRFFEEGFQPANGGSF